MSLIRKPIIWTRQPQHPVEIDWSNPLTRGLRFFSSPGIGISYNVVAETVGTRLPKTQGNFGDFTGTEYQKARAGILTNSRNTAMGGAISANGGEGYNYLFASNYDGGVNEPFSIRRQSMLRVATYNAGNEYFVECSPPTTDDYFVWYCVLGAGGSTDTNTIGWISTTGAITENSGSIAMASRTGFTAYSGAGANGTSVWRNYVKPILWSAYWDRELSSTERQLLAKNPWQLLKPISRTIYIPTVGGNKLLIASGGSYTITGSSAGISKSKYLSSSGGSYTLTGGSAQVSRNRKLTTTGGVYTYTGQSVTITWTGTSTAYTLTALSGSYALTGASAVVKKSKYLSGLGGSYNITGASSNILKSKYITASGGTYSFTGTPSTILRSKNISTTSGVYTYTGATANIKKSKYLSASGGVYSLVGSSANITWASMGGAVWPPVHVVLLGTVYGPTGTEYTGTLDVNGIKYDITTGQLVKPINDKVVMSI